MKLDPSYFDLICLFVCFQLNFILTIIPYIFKIKYDVKKQFPPIVKYVVTKVSKLHVAIELLLYF